MFLKNGKTMEKVRKRLKNKIIEKVNDEKLIKQQTKLNFNGANIPFTNYDSCTFEQIEFLMDEPFSLGSMVLELELPSLLMFETFF